MRTSLPRLLTLAICTVLSASSTRSSAQEHLSSNAVASASVPSPSGPKWRSSRHLITAQEVREARARNAYELVSRLRPNWLRTRGMSSLLLESRIVVYQDGIPVGGPEWLQQINADAVQSISYLNGIEATAQFGTGHGNGAILVRTRP